MKKKTRRKKCNGMWTLTQTNKQARKQANPCIHTYWTKMCKSNELNEWINGRRSSGKNVTYESMVRKSKPITQMLCKYKKKRSQITIKHIHTHRESESGKEKDSNAEKVKRKEQKNKERDWKMKPPEKNQFDLFNVFVEVLTAI